jgi:hypothetical protein
MPACKIIVGKMLGKDAVRDRRIDDMLHDTEEVLCDKLKNNS